MSAKSIVQEVFGKMMSGKTAKAIVQDALGQAGLANEEEHQAQGDEGHEESKPKFQTVQQGDQKVITFSFTLDPQMVEELGKAMPKGAKPDDRGDVLNPEDGGDSSRQQSSVEAVAAEATGEQKDEWGMALYDNGEGEDPGESDVLEWTKLGSAIIGNKSTLADTVHRVRIWVEEERSKDEPGGLWARVWNNDLDNAEANDRSVDEEPGEEFLLVEDVVGFDCVVQKDPKESDEDGRPKWEEEWATSNQIPFRVKLTFRMKPPEQGDEPLPLLRVVEIPLWDLSQNPISLDDKEKAAGARRGGQGGGQGGRPGPAGGGAGVAPGGRPGMPGTRPGGGVPGGMPGVGGGPGMGGPMR